MRHATAVRRLRQITVDAASVNRLETWPRLVGIYAFGPVLDRGDEMDAVDVALVIDAPAQGLPWGVVPAWATAMAHLLRLDKAPVRWFLRPSAWPVSNHAIRRPVRIWSLDGPDDEALDAIAGRRADRLRLPPPTQTARREQAEVELAACLAHLRHVAGEYWDRGWRDEHKGFGIYPENHLWNATWGYLDVLDDIQAGSGE